MTGDDERPDNTLNVPTGTEYGFGIALENCCKNALAACPTSDPPTEQEIQQMVGWVYAKSNRRTSPRMAEKCLRAIIDADQPGEYSTAAYLFGTGNALFFDENGEQDTELQRFGISGAHLYREEYPDAPIFWATWGRQESTRSSVHPNVFEYLKHPDDLDHDE
jgi:hypothetical protein